MELLRYACARQYQRAMSDDVELLRSATAWSEKSFSDAKSQLPAAAQAQEMWEAEESPTCSQVPFLQSAPLPVLSLSVSLSLTHTERERERKRAPLPVYTRARTHTHTHTHTGPLSETRAPARCSYVINTTARCSNVSDTTVLCHACAAGP